MKEILRKQFNIDCIGITRIKYGLSAMNYKVDTDTKPFFLKVYDKKKVQTSFWTANIDTYMPILVWLNANTPLRGKIVCPLENYKYEDDENIYLLFEYIEGENIWGKTLTQEQIEEMAEIMTVLHSYSFQILEENFDVSFCDSLEKHLSELQPYSEQIRSKINELRTSANKMKNKNPKMVLCHTDAHGKNVMMGKHMAFVDWEGMKMAPSEADLFIIPMFYGEEFWETFLAHYKKLRKDFVLDQEMFDFYTLRRNLDDLWAFLEELLYDKLNDEQREKNLNSISNGIKRTLE